MLESSLTVELIARLWREAGQHADLAPESLREFFQQSGMMPLAPEEQRGRRRYYFRKRAILQMNDDPTQSMGVYCRDISQQGIALLSPAPFLPLEQGLLTVSAARALDVRVRRCRRLAERCFLLGCDFAVEPQGGRLRPCAAVES